MSTQPMAAECGAAFTASAFLRNVYPGFNGTLYLTKEGLDSNHDPDGPREVTVSDVEAIDGFAAGAAPFAIVASPAEEPENPACLAMWFEPGAHTAEDKLTPSAALAAEDGRRVLVYLVDGSQSDLEVLRDALKSQEGATYRLSADVPVPGAAWALMGEPSFARYSAAEIDAAMLDPVQEGVSGEAYGFHPESLVFGHPYDCVLDQPLKASCIKHQRRRKAYNVAASVRELYAHTADHLESLSKEGRAIIGAWLDDDPETGKPRRMIRNVQTVSFIGFDFDSGQAADEVAGKLQKLGITFAMYSSYSHLKDGETAKFRVIIPLLRPFDTSAYPTREEANKVWKASYEAFGDTLGLDYDPMAKDMARLFYSPRHAPDRPYFSHVYAGTLLDLPIVEPEQAPIVKAARRRGKEVKFSTNGDAYVPAGTGLDFYLSLIGDGNDRLGFHNAIWRSLCSYFGTNGDEADIDKIILIIRDTVEKAPKNTGRDKSSIDRYLSDQYLREQAERARAYIREQREAAEASRGSDSTEFVEVDVERPAFDDARLQAAVEAIVKEREADRAIIDVLVDELAKSGDSLRLHSVCQDVKRYVPADALKKLVKERIKDLEQEHKVAVRRATEEANILPVIYDSTDFDVQCEAVEQGLVIRNQEPFLFMKGGAAVRLQHSEELDIRLVPMTKDALAHECNSAVHYLQERQERTRRAALPPDVIRHLFGAECLPFPEVDRILKTPIHAADGTLRTETGYDAATKCYFHLDGLSLSEVSSSPSETDVAEARRLLLDDVLRDFPFVDTFDGTVDAEAPGTGSRANAVAMILQPFTRALYNGPTPTFFIDKPTPATGAGLLVQTAYLINFGETAPIQTLPGNDDEVRKLITSKLLTGAPFVLFDNVKDKIRGQALAGFITSDRWEDRILGESRTVTLKVRCAAIMTGNNVSLEDEMTRRMVPIRLDARRPDPENRSGFKHENLEAWMLENRADLVWACLILVQNWFGKGRPVGKASLASFTDFCSVMGGILDAAGIHGFLTNLNAFRAAKKVEDNDETEFMQALFDHVKRAVKAGDSFTTADVYDAAFPNRTLAYPCLGIDEFDESSQRRILGMRLRSFLGRTFRIEDGDRQMLYTFARDDRQQGGKNTALWRLIEQRPS